MNAVAKAARTLRPLYFFRSITGFYFLVSRFRFWPTIGGLGFYRIRASICVCFFSPFWAAPVVLGRSWILAGSMHGCSIGFQVGFHLDFFSAAWLNPRFSERSLAYHRTVWWLIRFWAITRVMRFWMRFAFRRVLDVVWRSGLNVLLLTLTCSDGRHSESTERVWWERKWSLPKREVELLLLP